MYENIIFFSFFNFFITQLLFYVQMVGGNKTTSKRQRTKRQPTKRQRPKRHRDKKATTKNTTEKMATKLNHVVYLSHYVFYSKLIHLGIYDRVTESYVNSFIIKSCLIRFNALIFKSSLNHTIVQRSELCNTRKFNQKIR